jgi:crooked neck
LWKSYIDFEIEQEEIDRARDLYRRLLSKTQHVKVWMSFAQFELSTEENEDRLAQARSVYEEGNRSLRESGHDKEHRLMLLEAWRDFEGESGGEGERRAVAKLLPKRVKRRRKIAGEDGEEEGGGWEEYFDYIFPEDESAKPNLKLLAMAKMWKKQKEDAVVEDEEPSKEMEQSEEMAEKEGSPREKEKSQSGDEQHEEQVVKGGKQRQEENPDAYDQDMRNESSSESSSSEDEKKG